MEELEKMFEGREAVFTWMLHGEELSEAYASGDVFVMPSESETLGQVVLKAMSSALAVVEVQAGGIMDIISEEDEGRKGFCYTPGDLEDCISKVRRLVRDVGLREAIGRAARDEMEKYDWREATRTIRYQQYGAAMWFWRKKDEQRSRFFKWLGGLWFKQRHEQEEEGGGGGGC